MRLFNLCPLLRLWALTVELGGMKVNHQWIADRLTLTPPEGATETESPSRDAVRRLLVKVENDPDWFPGKSYQESFGPKKLLTPQKRKAIALSMMTQKDKYNNEPSYEMAVSRCPNASQNPETGKPFTKKYILDIFKTDCFDKNSEKPWRFQQVLQQTYLPECMRVERKAFALRELENAMPGSWYFNNLIWFDPNKTVRPAGPKKALDQQQTNKPQKRWISDDARRYSRNLPGPKYANTQTSGGDVRFDWILAMSRGRIGVMVMEEGWRPSGEGMAAFVERLPKLLKRMLGKTTSSPKVLYSDRGSGMFAPKTAVVNGKYGAAVEKNGFRLYVGGADGKSQPSDLADFLLHETACADFKYLLKRSAPPREPWRETREQFDRRVQMLVREANKHVNFDSLCCEYIDRVQQLFDRDGDRLPK